MQYHLIIQPFYRDYDFVEDICRISKSLYRIKRVEVLPRKMLPEYLLLSPKSLLAKFLMKKRKMIYLDDLVGELKKHFTYDSKRIILAILPHYVLGFGDYLAGLTPEPNLSIVSTYGINERHLSEACVGISLHEIGHNFGLRHCKSEGCLMKTPCKPQNFYNGVYRLCKEHENMRAHSLSTRRDGEPWEISPEDVESDSTLNFIESLVGQFGKHLNQLKTCFML